MISSYPSRVRIGSQTGTAMRRSSRNDDAAYTTYLSHEGWVPLLEPRSLVRWDAGFLTSTADRALELEEDGPVVMVEESDCDVAPISDVG